MNLDPKRQAMLLINLQPPQMRFEAISTEPWGCTFRLELMAQYSHQSTWFKVPGAGTLRYPRSN